MLVLTRKEGQQIMIGDHICLIVTEIRRGRVRIAVDAPPEVAVHRKEIYRKIRDEDFCRQEQPAC